MLLLVAMLSLGQTEPLDPVERAAALQRELEAQLADPAAEQWNDRLEALADRAGKLAETVEAPGTAVTARLIQARACHAMAQRATTDGRASLASLRLVQLRSVAGAIRRIDAPDARWLGDFWLLLADLIDAQRNARTAAEALIGSIAQLERFVSLHEERGGAGIGAAIDEVKFALMLACDQAGENERAMALLEELADPAATDEARRQIFAAVAENARLVGQRLDPALRDPDAPGWQLLIIHESDQIEATEAAAESLRQEWKQEISPPTIVLRPARRGELDGGLPQGLSEATPRYLLSDAVGTIRAVGHSPAILGRFAAQGSLDALH